MYETLYYHNEKINGKSFWILMIPNFRESVTLKGEDKEFFSDAEITLKESQYDIPEVFVSEDASWVLEKLSYGYHMYVTEYTKSIDTPLRELNSHFNRMLKICKQEYYKKKLTEIRLYFYDSSIDRLQLCCDRNPSDFYIPLSGKCIYKYAPSDTHHPATVFYNIDKKFPKPKDSCFIFGRIRKSIGLKNSKFMDFIEPMNIVPLDFKKEEHSYFGEYERNLEILEDALFELLLFSISKKYNNAKIMRIREFLKNSTDTDSSIAKMFIKEFQKACNEGNTEKLRQLYDVISNKAI